MLIKSKIIALTKNGAINLINESNGKIDNFLKYNEDFFSSINISKDLKNQISLDDCFEKVGYIRLAKKNHSNGKEDYSKYLLYKIVNFNAAIDIIIKYENVNQMKIDFNKYESDKKNNISYNKLIDNPIYIWVKLINMHIDKNLSFNQINDKYINYVIKYLKNKMS